MEFIEYYQLLRRYFWAPLLLMLIAGLGGALVYFLGPTVWKASGQMLAQAGTAYRVRWAGAEVELVEEPEVWGTLQQLVESRTVAEQAAQEAGLLQQGRSDKLSPLTFQRDKRGNIFKITAAAGTAAAAKSYAAEAMATMAEIWDQTRLQRAQTVGGEIEDRLARLTPVRDRVLAEMQRLEAGPPPGPPAEALRAVQTEVTQLQGAIGTSTVDAGAARDRFTALSTLAQRDARARPDAQANPTIAALQARLTDLQNQRRRMLLARTENHPEVAALDEEIQATKRDLQRLGPQFGGGGPSTVLEQQLVLARTDVQASQRRLQELRSRQAALQARLTDLHVKAAAHRQLQEQLEPLDDERTTLLANVKTVSTEIQRLKSSEDLRVIEPAQATESNRNPTRLLMLVGGSSFAGLILGVLLAFVLHYIQSAGGSRPEESAKTPA